MAQLSRRRFIEMLGIAPLAFNAHRVYFDMGRKLWMPQTVLAEPLDIPSILEQLNAVSQLYLDTAICNTFNVSHAWMHDVRLAQRYPQADLMPDLVGHIPSQNLRKH
jgi:hypothetical protein